MRTVLSLSDFHPRDRLAYWYDVACKVFVKHNCQVHQPSRFDVTMDHGALGDLGVVSLETRGLTFAEVTKRTIAAGEDDVFFLCLQLSGMGTFNQDGRETTIHPGDFMLLDAQRPYTCNYAAAWKQIIIKSPHRSLKARLGAGRDVTALAARYADSLGGLASGYIKMLPDRMDALDPTARIQIAEHVLDLTAMSLASVVGKERPAISSGSALTLLQLRTTIENSLSDPALDPTTAAAAAGISVRYANALLAKQGTSLERLIVSRRLDHCRQALEDPAQANRTITDIAFGWGFHDASHFNRRFKAAFGCSPSDYRRGARA
jgi:AraC-like DNA-binding protein